MRYLCHYQIISFSEEITLDKEVITMPALVPRIIIKTCDVPNIPAIKEGFWINNKERFTKMDDCESWIPPSSIINVTKIHEVEEDGP